MASAAILCRYRSTLRLRYWKPIQTGVEQDDDTREVQRLARCQPDEVLDCGVRLPRPLSPHLSARLAGRSIDLASVVHEAAAEADADARGWIVEGAGGVLVPVNESEMMVDLIDRLRLPVLVVARSGLGTINHTLLTLEALRAHASTCAVAGVLLVGEPDSENRRAIEEFGGVRVVGEMPPLRPLTPDGLAAWAERDLDREGQLVGCLREGPQ